MTVHKINTPDEFDTALKSNKVIIVKFTATWCGPCKKIAPLFKTLSDENSDIYFIEVDVDKMTKSGGEDVLSNCGVTCMPMFITFYDSKIVDNFPGADSEKLTKMVKSINDLYSTTNELI